MLHFQVNTKSKVTNKYQYSHFPFAMLTSKKSFEKQNACFQELMFCTDSFLNAVGLISM